MRFHHGPSPDAILPPRPSVLGAWGGVGIAVGALLLGGATTLWAQMILAFAIGGLLIAFPPRRSLGLLLVAIPVLLVIIAGTAFLPDRWLGQPAWKEHLTAGLGITSSTMRTPQPVLTAEAMALFFLGGLWAYWALAFDWGRRLRVRVCRGIVVGVAILSAIAVYCFYSDADFPLWEQAKTRGFFPGRDQMTDVLVLGGILNYALLHEGLRQRKWWDLIWLLPLAVIAAAIVTSDSRVGIILGFAGISVWHFASCFRRQSIQKTALSAIVFVLAGAMLFLIGKAAHKYFPSPFSGSEPSQSVLHEARTILREGVPQLSTQSPWLGAGLGNFSPLFAMERQRLGAPSTPSHLGSDWLWCASELGWPAAALLLLGLGWWATKCVRLPPDEEEWHALRFAAAIGVVLFALHGAVDLSGHRLGSAMFALLLAGIAMPLHELPRTAWAPGIMRVLGLLPVFIGCWWLQSIQNDERWPSSATVAQHQINIGNALDANDLKTMLAESEAALRIAPLDAPLYFQHGSANALLGGDVQRSYRDFQCAVAFQPAGTSVYFDIGAVWLKNGRTEFAIEAWTEGLKRAGGGAPAWLRRMLQAARDAPVVRSALRQRALQDPALLLVSLQSATAEEARSDIAAFLLQQPELKPLTAEQQSEFVVLWWRKGDRDSLIPFLDWHPKLNEQMWSYRAETLAAQSRFREAWKMVVSHVKPPPLPRVTPTRSVFDLQREFAIHPDDFATGYMLFFIQNNGHRDEDALYTLRKLAALPDCPPYIFWAQATLYAKRSGWPEAWSAWLRYRATAR